MPSGAVGLPSKYQPSFATRERECRLIWFSYLLPDGITGVVSCSTSFASNCRPLVVVYQNDDEGQFQVDVATIITSLEGVGATRLLIDLTNSPGGFICEGFFLYQYLSGLTSLFGTAPHLRG
jgi:hypothetical protein